MSDLKVPPSLSEGLFARVNKRTGSTGRGLTYSVFAGIASILAGLALLPLVIGSVGAGPYGAWLFLIAISSYFNYTDLGVGTAIVHFGSRARSGDREFSMSQLASAAVLWTCCIGVVVIPIFSFLSWLYIQSVADGLGISLSDRMLIAAMATLVACGLLIRPFTGVLVGSGYLLLDRKFQFIGVGVRIAGTVLACLVFRSVAAVAVAEAVALLTPTLLALVATRQHGLARIRLSRSLWPTLKKMMGFSMRSFAVSISSALISNGGTLLIGLVGSPVQVTYFAAATRVLNGVGQITSWASAPFQPALSRLFHSSPRRASFMVHNLIFSSFSISTITCGVLMWIAHPAVVLWLGDAVATDVVASTIILLLSGAVLNSLQGPLLLASDASGKPGIFFVAQFSVAAMFLGLGLAFGSQFGAIGIALARLVPIIIISPVYIVIAKRYFGMRVRTWWRSSVFPAVMFLVPSLICAYAVGAFIADDLSISAWLPGVAYGIASILFAVLLRSKLPLRELGKSLRSPM